MTQAQTLLSCSTLNSYLKTLQSETLSELYNHPATCLAVFRELPDLAKQFVMRLFYVEQAVPQAVVLSWVNQASYGEKAKESSTALTELGIWKDTAMPGGTFLFLIKFLYILLSSDAGSGLAIAILANLEAKPFISIISTELTSILAPPIFRHFGVSTFRFKTYSFNFFPRYESLDTRQNVSNKS